MTSITTARPLLTRFETYLAGAFHPIPHERVVAGMVQSFYGWFFQFLRNAFLCGVLTYLADSSGSLTLKILAGAAYVVLAAYCLSHVNGAVTPFHFVRYKRLAFWLDTLVTLAVLAALGYAILAGTSYAINEIAKGHVASRSPAPSSPARPSPGP